MDIKGKIAIVTGGAAGIGRASAVALARKQAAKIIVTDIDENGMAETARLVEAEGARCEIRRVDISDLDALVSWLAEVERNGGYDILFNNAGVVTGAPAFPVAGPAKIDRIVRINLTSAIVATEIAAQAMQARGGGVIVNTISTVALTQGFADTLYAATKTGLLMFNRCCAPLKDSMNVRVAGVLPGLTDTPIVNKTGADGQPSQWMESILSSYPRCRPEDIADAVIDLIEDDALPGGAWVAVRNLEGQIEREWG